jgi:hypothetical protein
MGAGDALDILIHVPSDGDGRGARDNNSMDSELVHGIRGRIPRGHMRRIQAELPVSFDLGDPASQPAWLTDVTFAGEIQPRLAKVRPADIMNAIGVSWLYASHIRRGMKRPHPRHWVKLAELVGLLD